MLHVACFTLYVASRKLHVACCVQLNDVGMVQCTQELDLHKHGTHTLADVHVRQVRQATDNSELTAAFERKLTPTAPLEDAISEKSSKEAADTMQPEMFRLPM